MQHPAGIGALAQGATASTEALTAALKEFGNETFTKEDKVTMKLRLQEMLGVPEEWMPKITIKHMLVRPQMMWGFHKYRLEPWVRPTAPGRMY